ncbi:hypothetical protein [Inhella gelatinilytica]|uniref:DUF4279 domain-containing protein n=1 Tax=Inhella gelatinilytica TaxID=2795030 RepID=A0A931NDW8_9BURK|nr:hypothetical protein [Inhella gelatinilytica]MBH9553069.1 hypothetical protein [Inhella gelatinilytica]
MTCILRVGGHNLDIDTLMDSTELEVDSFWKKGERRFPSSDSNTKVNDSSGLRILVSESDMSDISAQMDDALKFFQEHRERIERIVSHPGVEWAVADFGAEIRPPGWSCFCFPAALAAAIGLVGVSLELSVYPTDDGEDSE